MDVLHRLAKPLPESLQWHGQDQLQGYLCEQAMRERAEKEAGGNPGDLFRKFLPWAPLMMPLLAEKLEELRGVRGHHEELAWELIAGSLRTKAQFISQLDQPSRVQRTKPISRQDMSRLILKAKLAEIEAAKTAEPAVDQRQQVELEATKAERDRLAAYLCEFKCIITHPRGGRQPSAPPPELNASARPDANLGLAPPPSWTLPKTSPAATTKSPRG